MSFSIPLLMSFPYWSAKHVGFVQRYPADAFRFIVDSGAFSQHHAGVEIDLHSYGEFLLRFDIPQRWTAIQLDVVGNHAATWDNYQESIRLGYPVCPVVHHGMPLSMIDEIVAAARENKADRIFIGGLLQTGSVDMTGFLRWFSDKYPGQRVHWLGRMKLGDIQLLRPTSVDSSRISSVRFGIMMVYRTPMMFVEVRKRHYVVRKDVQERVLPLLRRLGFAEADAVALRSLLAWKGKAVTPGGEGEPTFREGGMGLSDRINLVGCILGAKKAEEATGCEIYQAMSSVEDFRRLKAAANYVEGKGLG